MTKRILISAGEPSGDLHASNLVKELKRINSDLEFVGIGCDKLESLGVKMLERMDSLSIVGVWEILAKLSHINKIFRKIENEAEKNKVDLAILIDYPGFNLILAKKLNKYKIPCVYYITPQFWAWGAWRIANFKKYITKAITILAFEEALFKKQGVDADFVGHPLLDEKTTSVLPEDLKKEAGLKPDKFTIALLPGSRPLEVKRMLPVMIETAKLIRNKMQVQFVISQSPNVDESIFKGIIKDFDAIVIKSDIHKCLCAADFVLTSSGTVTLEAAIAEKPMLIMYITSFLTAFLGRLFIRTPYIGLVNVIAGKEIVPEILQYNARPKFLAEEILGIVNSKDKMDGIKNNLKSLKGLLGSPGASMKAARIINGLILQQ